MTDLVDRTIAALRSEHDVLVDFATSLSAEQFAAASGADDWTVAQVISHLGSGAEIGRAPIAIAAGETVHPGGQPGDLGAMGCRRAGRAGRVVRRP